MYRPNYVVPKLNLLLNILRVVMQIKVQIQGFSLRMFLRILVAGKRCNVTGEYFERGSTTK